MELSIRGIRSFLALVREPDFQESLNKNILNDWKIYSELEEDMLYHSDIIIKTNNDIIYRLWLYTNSGSGTDYNSLSAKLTGQRGKIGEGINILFPINTALLRKKSEILKMINTKEVNISKKNEENEFLLNKKNLTDNQREKYENNLRIIEENKKFIEDKKNILDEILYLESKKTIIAEDLAGFYLYTEDFVKEVLNYIRGIDKKEIIPLEYLDIKYDISNIYGKLSSFFM